MGKFNTESVSVDTDGKSLGLKKNIFTERNFQQNVRKVWNVILLFSATATSCSRREIIHKKSCLKGKHFPEHFEHKIFME